MYMDIYILIIYKWILNVHVQFIDLYILILVGMFDGDGIYLYPVYLDLPFVAIKIFFFPHMFTFTNSYGYKRMV